MDKDTRINVKVKLWLLQYKELKENTCILSTEHYHSRKCERELSDDVTLSLPLILTPSFSEIAWYTSLITHFDYYVLSE